MSKECLCLRCAKQGKTCCQQTDIYITCKDTERIETYICKNDFYEFRKPSNPAYLDQDDDPIWNQAIFRPDGTRRVLKRDPFGNCAFLGQSGCTLPLEVRPLICRLHPHVYNADGIYTELDNDCPVYLLETGETLEQSVSGFCMEDARRWHQMLYTEILLEKDKDEYRTHLRFAI